MVLKETVWFKKKKNMAKYGGNIFFNNNFFTLLYMVHSDCSIAVNRVHRDDHDVFF